MLERCVASIVPRQPLPPLRGHRARSRTTCRRRWNERLTDARRPPRDLRRAVQLVAGQQPRRRPRDRRPPAVPQRRHRGRSRRTGSKRCSSSRSSRQIGAVGAKLLFPDGGLQHVGVTVARRQAGPPVLRLPGRAHRATTAATCLPHNCAAVTGACLMTRRDVFDEVGGFDEAFPLNYNDVDYCLRVRQARLPRRVHAARPTDAHESVTKAGVFAEELDAFRARWGKA